MIQKTALSLLLCAASLQAAPRRAVLNPPATPACSMIIGTPAVTFTRDEGERLTPTAEHLTGLGYTYGLATLDTPGALLAWHNNILFASDDHGCTWRGIAAFENLPFPPRITAARGGRAYAWSDNNRFLVRHDSRGTVLLEQPAAFVGFAADRDDADHVRAGADDGSVWDSRDAGETWTQLGRVKPDSSPVIFYRFEFDPASLDHIVAGTSVAGAYYSSDGGRTWGKSSLGSGRTNAFNFAVSPVDGNVVWAMALDLADEGRHIYRSTDGGATYLPVVDQTAEIILINGPIMAAHPTNSNVLYFIFGTYYQGYGTDIYRYDAFRGIVTKTHNDYDGVNAIAFSRSQPDVMYLGLEVERGAR